MFSLMNFDNVVFEGKLANMPILFTNFSDPNYEPSKFYAQKFARGMAARTQDVIYDVLKIYKGTYPKIKGFVAETNKGYAAELQDGNDTYCCHLLKKKDGSYYIKATVIDENDITTSFHLDNSSKKLILLALMPEILKETEARGIYDTMSDFLEWDVDAQDWIFNDHIQEFSRLLNKFSTNIEMRLTTAETDTIKIDTEKVSNLKLADLEIDVVKTLCGIPKKFHATTSAAQQTADPATTVSGFEGSYRYSERTFTEAETNLLAKIPEKYVMPDFVPEICNYFKSSSNFPAPMRVAYLIGPAGTGKTEAANAIFAGLGLPGGHYTCNPSTEIFDFIGQVFPNCSDEALSWDEIRKTLGLPSEEDIVNDPVSAYKAVYGKEPTGYPDEGQIIRAMVEKVMTYMSELGNGKNFRYVESGLIRAARLGYGFEIQEIGCVLRPGVAVGLNALLETGGNAYITLPTGETIKKHPECTIVFTSNDEYEGCCNLNQSVLDRMSLVYRIENPPKEAMKNRIISRLSFPDEKILERMIDVIEDLSRAAKEKGIEDGVCGYRALENWAMAVMIKSMGNTITDAVCYQTAIQTVMNKVSQKKEYVEELMTCLTYQFAAPNKI